MVQAIVAGLWVVVTGNDAERPQYARQQHDGAMNAQRIAIPGDRHRKSTHGHHQ